MINFSHPILALEFNMFLENFYPVFGNFFLTDFHLGRDCGGDRNCTICFCIWYLLYLTAVFHWGGGWRKSKSHDAQIAKGKNEIWQSVEIFQRNLHKSWWKPSSSFIIKVCTSHQCYHHQHHHCQRHHQPYQSSSSSRWS